MFDKKHFLLHHELMKSIRKLPSHGKVSEKITITKLGKVRKKYTKKKTRDEKPFSINVAITESHKNFLEKKAEEKNVKPTEIVRKLLDVVCKDVVVVDDLKEIFSVFIIDKEKKNDSIEIDQGF